jgi:3-dehydroquinate dehydratase
MKAAQVMVNLIIEIEVDMANFHSRGEFRYDSVITPIAKGQTLGFGVHKYCLGLRAAWDSITG